MWATTVVAADLKVGDFVGHLPDAIANGPLDQLDLRSGLIGFAAGFVIAWIISMVLGTAKTLIKYAIIAALMAGAAGGYFAEVRRRAGLSDAMMASPMQIIDDARGAADKMRHHLDSTKGTLDKVEKDR